MSAFKKPLIAPGCISMKPAKIADVNRMLKRNEKMKITAINFSGVQF
jgi:hypothetical protein